MASLHIHEQARKAMQRYACRDLSGKERIVMEGLVEQFFTEQADQLPPGEVMRHMATPMQALAWFNPFLCQTYWNHCCTGGASRDADACPIN